MRVRGPFEATRVSFRPFVFCCGQCDLVRLKDDSVASRNDSEGFAS